MEYATDQTVEVPNEEDDTILPEGWDGESSLLEMFESEESPTTDEPALETEDTETEEATTEDGELETEQLEEVEEVEEAPTTEPSTPIMPPTPKVRIKYNHEEKEMELDEAAQWVQKGLHHDKINPTYEKVNALAKQMGYKTADELLSAAEDNFISQQVQELVDEGVHESVAETVVRAKLGMLKREEPELLIEPEPQPDPVALRQAEIDRDVDIFVKTYPGVTQVPDAVLKACRENGTPLVAAYAKWESEKARQELKILKQNQASAAKAPVGGATIHGSVNMKSQEKDPFTEGFDSDTW